MVIETTNLTKRYGRRIGIQGLDLCVPEGTLFGFLGPNGSGKTTTIRTLLGFLRPTEGSARLFGMDCWRESHRIKAEIGYLPGDVRLYPWLTGHEALRIFGGARGRDLRTAGRELAEYFGFDPTVRVRSMSRGTRQKLGLILALVHRPKLLVLDEPTASLDPLMQEKLYSRLRALATAGHTIFFSSHTLSEVERLCDRIVILRAGHLVADEPLQQLRARARRRVTILWHDNADPTTITPPSGLRVHDRDGRRWEASLTGSVMDLVRWSAGQPMDDLVISEPDLNALFQQYYTAPERNA